MIECFPPVPIYIVAGIILAMFTTVTSKIGSDKEEDADAYFALFLLAMLTIPFVTLLFGLITTMLWSSSLHCEANCCNRWILGAHAVTIGPLMIGAAIWFWTRSDFSIRRFRIGGT